MRGSATLADARNPSPQPSPLAPQRERESKTYDFVALLPINTTGSFDSTSKSDNLIL